VTALDGELLGGSSVCAGVGAGEGAAAGLSMCVGAKYVLESGDWKYNGVTASFPGVGVGAGLPVGVSLVFFAETKLWERPRWPW
jgi:hypothetical protein